MRALKYISWGDSTGYATAAKSYVRALAAHGIQLTWTPMLTGRNLYELQTSREWPCPTLKPLCNRPLEYDTVLIHTVPEYYPELIRQERAPGRRILGYTVWELERLPAHWPSILNQLDGVIVPTDWNRRVFLDAGVTVPVHVVPHLSQFEGLPPPTDSERARLLERLGGEKTLSQRHVFYTIGFWSNRKAPYLALEAYWRAFVADDPVVMIVKTTARDHTRWQRHWRNAWRLGHPPVASSIKARSKRHARPAPWVLIDDESLSEGEMRALHELGLCFVSLPRAEGWGLGAFEAARLGRPVITTGYGGHLAYLDADSSWLVDYHRVKVLEPAWSGCYQANDQWAEPNIDQAAAHMREIMADAGQAVVRARRQADRIETTFSRDQTLTALLTALTSTDR